MSFRTYPEATDLPPDDRLPTADEVAALDVAAAWDCLTPDQQREIGILAVRFGVISQRLLYPHSAPAWTRDRVNQLHVDCDRAMNALPDGLADFWPQIFGWAPIPSNSTESLNAILRLGEVSMHLPCEHRRGR